MVIDLRAKNQANICKRLGKKAGKLILRTDRRTEGLTDRRTECKPEVPFGFSGRGLISIQSENRAITKGNEYCPLPQKVQPNETQTRSVSHGD